MLCTFASIYLHNLRCTNGACPPRLILGQVQRDIPDACLWACPPSVSCFRLLLPVVGGETDPAIREKEVGHHRAMLQEELLYEVHEDVL